MKYAKAILLSIATWAVLDVLIPDHVLNVVVVVMMSILGVGVLLVAFGTIRKNQWGLNPDPVNCPVCGSLIPKVRRPKSLKQSLWGGANCEKCGCEMDKWGRLIT